MSKTYVVAVDGSSHGWKALDLAATLAKSSDAALRVVTVVSFDPLPEGFDQWAKIEGLSVEKADARQKLARTLGDTIIREAETRASDAGIDAVRTDVLQGDTAKAIVDYVTRTSADMVFLGSRGLSDIQGMLLGSVSHKVSHLVPCTCILVK